GPPADVGRRRSEPQHHHRHHDGGQPAGHDPGQRQHRRHQEQGRAQQGGHEREGERHQRPPPGPQVARQLGPGQLHLGLDQPDDPAADSADQRRDPGALAARVESDPVHGRQGLLSWARISPPGCAALWTFTYSSPARYASNCALLSCVFGWTDQTWGAVPSMLLVWMLPVTFLSPNTWMVLTPVACVFTAGTSWAPVSVADLASPTCAIEDCPWLVRLDVCEQPDTINAVIASAII